MSDDSAEEREREATGKHLSDMRSKGNVLRSKDLSSGIIYLTAVILLIFLSQNFAAQMEFNYRFAFGSIQSIMTNEHFPGEILHNVIIKSLHLIIPILIILFCVAFLPPFLYGGWNFTLDVFTFKLPFLNFIPNLFKLFSGTTGMELAKSFIKLTFILGALIVFSFSYKRDLIDLSNAPLHEAINHSFTIIKQFVILMTCSLIFVVMFDVFVAYFKYRKEGKMTDQEVKDEQKQTEGNVEVKRKIRLNQLKMLRQQIQKAVPKANVIITNPTHYAVALRYQDRKDRAPKVIAKGKDLLASQIRSLAIVNAIPIYQAPTLARALYHTTKIGGEIHPELYMAVAIVLSYIQQLRNYQHGLGRLPEITSDLKIPKEFIYDE